ncbi:MAG: CYTH domain-containing protein [Tissierellia bacterium]|nr:CYTH domain-containing protein [Tissierellia bacterium]
MAKEIERKFLVKSTSFLYGHDAGANGVGPGVKIVQGYISAVPERTVRVRIKGDKGYITIKGATDNSGLVRYEWEKEIGLDDANDLLKLCVSGLIEKTRYKVEFSGHLFEVDIFEGRLKGLVIAELELKSEDETFEAPDWLGEEVTGNPRYYNSQL